MLALCSMLLLSYYAQDYAGIIDSSLWISLLLLFIVAMNGVSLVVSEICDC